MATLEDKATGITAAVTSDRHLEVNARTYPVPDREAIAGNSYNFNTGSITLTNASTANGICYLKNTATDGSVYIITAFFYLMGNSTGGTGDGRWEILRNPSTGTLIESTPTTQAPVNRNFGSGKVLTGDFYKAGASGDTITNGTVAIESLLSSPAGRVTITVGAVVLNPGDSVGMRYTTQASNTSQAVEAAVAIYKQTLTL